MRVLIYPSSCLLVVFLIACQQNNGSQQKIDPGQSRDASTPNSNGDAGIQRPAPDAQPDSQKEKDAKINEASLFMIDLEAHAKDAQ